MGPKAWTLSVREACEREAGPYGVLIGDDGVVWTTLVHSGEVLRLDRSTQEINRLTVGEETSAPSQLHSGPGGLWVSLQGADQICRLGSDSSVQVAQLPEGSFPFGVVSDDHGCWVSCLRRDRISYLDDDHDVRDAARLPPGAMPSMLTRAPNGDVWAALNGISAIGRLAADGTFDVIPTPTTGAGPVGVTSANGGEVWFTEFLADQVGRLRPDGSITEYPLPERGSRPHAIAADPWGGLWFTEWGAHRVGRITEAGRVDEFDLPQGVREPHGVAVSESGSVCVAAESGHLVFLDPA